MLLRPDLRKYQTWDSLIIIDVIHGRVLKATRDYTACSPAKLLHAPNTDVDPEIFKHPARPCNIFEVQSSVGQDRVVSRLWDRLETRIDPKWRDTSTSTALSSRQPSMGVNIMRKVLESRPAPCSMSR